MPLGQGEPRHRSPTPPNSLMPTLLEGRPDHREMPRARDPLRITPAMPTSSRKLAQPRATAAAVSIWPFTSSTSTTGQPSDAATSDVAAAPARAVEQAHHALGDDEVGRMARDEVGQHAAATSPSCRD